MIVGLTLLAFGTVLGAVTASGVAIESTLVVDAENGTELLSVPVEPNSTVALVYTHSVEKTTVRDVYAVRDGGFTMTYTEFSSYGAGLPSTAPVERSGNGTYLYRPDDRHYDEIWVKTGSIAGHELVVDGTRYDLVGIADGETVRLHVTHRTRLNDVIERLPT